MCDVFIDLHQHGDQNVSQQLIYRFEEIPQSELNLTEDEMLIPVSHFYKNVHDLFGIPFFVKVVQGEPFYQLKSRIQNKLGVPEKEWEKVCAILLHLCIVWRFTIHHSGNWR